MQADTLEQLKERLSNPNELIRDGAFESIIKGFSQDAKDLLIDIIVGTDESIKISLCQYIRKYVHTKKGLLILKTFIESGREFVQKEAAKALDEIECPERKDVCIDLLRSDEPFAIEYAIDQVYTRHYVAGIDYLMLIYQNFNKGTPDQIIERKVKIIKVIRQLKRTEAIPYLFNIISDADEYLLYEILYTLGFFFKYIKPYRFLKYVDHSSPTIRKVTIWILNHYRTKKIRRMLFDRYFLEKDPAVKGELVDGLGNYNDFKTAQTLLHMAVFDKANIRLLADSALNRISPKMILRLLRKYRNNKNEKVRVCIVAKSSVVARKQVVRWLSRIIQKDPSPYVRAACAEALGKSLKREVVPLLEHVLFNDSSELVRYSAHMALSRLWNKSDEKMLQYIIDLPENEYIQAHMITLRFIQKKILRENWCLSKELADRILFRLSSSDVKIRYLCIEIMKLVKDKRALIPLVDLYMSSSSESEIQIVLQTIQELIYNDPMFLFGFLVQSRRRKELFCSVLEIMEKVTFSPDYDYEIVLQLAMLFLRDRSKSIKVKIVTAFFTIFKRVYYNIPELTGAGNEHWIQVIMDCAKFANNEELAVFGPDIFLENINHNDEAVQKTAIFMLGMLKEERAIPDLTVIALSHKSSQIRQLAKDTLNRIIVFTDVA